jgi:hypothetical protein
MDVFSEQIGKLVKYFELPGNEAIGATLGEGSDAMGLLFKRESDGFSCRITPEEADTEEGSAYIAHGTEFWASLVETMEKDLLRGPLGLPPLGNLYGRDGQGRREMMAYKEGKYGYLKEGEGSGLEITLSIGTAKMIDAYNRLVEDPDGEFDLVPLGIKRTLAEKEKAESLGNLFKTMLCFAQEFSEFYRGFPGYLSVIQLEKAEKLASETSGSYQPGKNPRGDVSFEVGN